MILTSAELTDRLRPKAVAKQAAELAKRRREELADAFHFLTVDAEKHADRCVYKRRGGVPCTRSYDPLPYREALPDDLRMYEGTGVGAIYGLPGSEVLAWQLAGWNLTPYGKEKKL